MQKKYKIPFSVIKNANESLIQKGISEKTKRTYDGIIKVEYKTKKGTYLKKNFTKKDIKTAFKKALYRLVKNN